MQDNCFFDEINAGLQEASEMTSNYKDESGV